MKQLFSPHYTSSFRIFPLFKPRREHIRWRKVIFYYDGTNIFGWKWVDRKKYIYCPIHPLQIHSFLQLSLGEHESWFLTLELAVWHKERGHEKSSRQKLCFVSDIYIYVYSLCVFIYKYWNCWMFKNTHTYTCIHYMHKGVTSCDSNTLNSDMSW